MNTYCVILAAGKGIRFKVRGNKLFYKLNNTPIVEFTLKKFTSVFSKDEIFIVVNKEISKQNSKLINLYTNNKLIIGGKTRFESLKNFIISMNEECNILIHDAARPNTSTSLIKKIKKEIELTKYDAVIPFLEITDSLKNKKNNKFKSVNRSDFIRTQTPQAIKLNRSSLKLIIKTKSEITDESELFDNKDKKIKYIKGEEDNIKITSRNDLLKFQSLLTSKFLIGNAFDIHRLTKGNSITLGGIKIKSKYKLLGHSDGDVVLHAIIDAMLGTLSKGDIGTYFPSSQINLKGISSIILLKKIIKILRYDSLIISNLDITIITEIVRLEKYKIKIEDSVSKLLNLDKKKINIKAKTTDGIGLIGKSKAISCLATMIVIKK